MLGRSDGVLLNLVLLCFYTPKGLRLRARLPTKAHKGLWAELCLLKKLRRLWTASSRVLVQPDGCF